MAVPKGREARRFYQCAFRKHDEAVCLRDGDFTTGAVYLAGYAVECAVKALLLDATPASRHPELRETFRGTRGHNIPWLLEQYYAAGGARPPRDVRRSFTAADGWTTDLRYDPRRLPDAEAAAFLRAATIILQWADGRL